MTQKKVTAVNLAQIYEMSMFPLQKASESGVDAKCHQPLSFFPGLHTYTVFTNQYSYHKDKRKSSYIIAKTLAKPLERKLFNQQTVCLTYNLLWLALQHCSNSHLHYFYNGSCFYPIQSQHSLQYSIGFSHFLFISQTLFRNISWQLR